MPNISRTNANKFIRMNKVKQRNKVTKAKHQQQFLLFFKHSKKENINMNQTLATFNNIITVNQYIDGSANNIKMITITFTKAIRISKYAKEKKREKKMKTNFILTLQNDDQIICFSIYVVVCFVFRFFSREKIKRFSFFGNLCVCSAFNIFYCATIHCRIRSPFEWCLFSSFRSNYKYSTRKGRWERRKKQQAPLFSQFDQNLWSTKEKINRYNVWPKRKMFPIPNHHIHQFRCIIPYHYYYYSDDSVATRTIWQI